MTIFYNFLNIQLIIITEKKTLEYVKKLLHFLFSQNSKRGKE